MTIQQPSENEFLSALDRLERSLETPIIPGELPTWLRTVRNLFAEVDSKYELEIEEIHSQILQQIARQDPELVARVEQLQGQDEELMTQWRALQGKSRRLRNDVEQIEPHESAFEDRVEKFRDEALGFVIEARKQEAALTAWYAEALQRDRGVAD